MHKRRGREKKRGRERERERERGRERGGRERNRRLEHAVSFLDLYINVRNNQSSFVHKKEGIEKENWNKKVVSKRSF